MKNLKEVYKPYFKIGAAVNRRSIKSHEDLITRHFSSITCENEMKYGPAYKAEGELNLDGADEIYAFAQKNGIEMRGHTFVWHNQTPDFIFKDNDRDKTLKYLETHMKLMSERYDKGVYAWDVVNEAIEDKGDIYLRKTKWLELFGDNYITEVFKLAGGILKGKDLYYNDYNETNPEKRAKIIKLVKELLQNGAPINGIGLQTHYNIFTPTIDEVKETIEQYAALGLKLSITEMDISLYAPEDKSSLPEPSAELMEKQADYYDRCFKIYREYSKHIDSVTLWGVADDMTWLRGFPVRRNNWPLLFDENHEPKEAFLRITEF